MLAQYANSPVITKLVNGIKEQINNAKTIEDWYKIVFDIRQATGYGLDVWGKILNQSRRISYDDNGTTVNVYLKGAQTVDNVSYTEEQIEDLYRMVLFFRAFSYIGNCTVKSLNDLLNFFFSDLQGQEGNIIAVQEIGVMSIDVYFNFFVDKLKKAIIKSDILPHPTGVQMNFRFIPSGSWFGFFVSGKTATEQPFAPFDKEPFYPYLTE